MPVFDYKGKLKTHSSLRLAQNEENVSVKEKEATIFYVLVRNLIKLGEYL